MKNKRRYLLFFALILLLIFVGWMIFYVFGIVDPEWAFDTPLGRTATAVYIHNATVFAYVTETQAAITLTAEP
jgi:hypothetical protein